jgi:hypothetical protein
MSALCVGCGGTKEIAPDASQVKQVDPAEIQKNIQEGMKQGGGGKQPTYNPGK